MIQLHELQPCSSGQTLVHVILAVFGGLNMLLTTALTVTIRRNGKKEAGRGHRQFR